MQKIFNWVSVDLKITEPTKNSQNERKKTQRNITIVKHFKYNNNNNCFEFCTDD